MTVIKSAKNYPPIVLSSINHDDIDNYRYFMHMSIDNYFYSTRYRHNINLESNRLDRINDLQQDITINLLNSSIFIAMFNQYLIDNGYFTKYQLLHFFDENNTNETVSNHNYAYFVSNEYNFSICINDFYVKRFLRFFYADNLKSYNSVYSKDFLDDPSKYHVHMDSIKGSREEKLNSLFFNVQHLIEIFGIKSSYDTLSEILKYIELDRDISNLLVENIIQSCVDNDKENFLFHCNQIKEETLSEFSTDAIKFKFPDDYINNIRSDYVVMSPNIERMGLTFNLAIKSCKNEVIICPKIDFNMNSKFYFRDKNIVENYRHLIINKENIGKKTFHKSYILGSFYILFKTEEDAENFCSNLNYRKYKTLFPNKERLDYDKSILSLSNIYYYGNVSHNLIKGINTLNSSDFSYGNTIPPKKNVVISNSKKKFAGIYDSFVRIFTDVLMFNEEFRSITISDKALFESSVKTISNIIVDNVKQIKSRFKDNLDDGIYISINDPCATKPQHVPHDKVFSIANTGKLYHNTGYHKMSYQNLPSSMGISRNKFIKTNFIRFGDIHYDSSVLENFICKLPSISISGYVYITYHYGIDNNNSLKNINSLVKLSKLTLNGLDGIVISKQFNSDVGIVDLIDIIKRF